MRSMKLLGASAMAVFALFAVTVSSAFATTGPRFFVAGSALSGSETISAEASGAQVLSASSIEIECPTVSATGGEIKGTEPGTDGETLVYGGCKDKTKPGCEARTKGGGTAGQIATNALSSEVYYQESTPNEFTDTVFTPASGTTFVEIEMKTVTESCPVISSATVEGSVAVEDETGEREVQTLTAPKTPIKEVFTASGAGVKVGLKAFGFVEAKYIGKDKVKLSGTKKGSVWGVKG